MPDISITKNQYMIEQGYYFTAEYLFSAVANDGYAYIRITNPDANKKLSVQLNINNTAKCYVATFAGTTYTGNGTAVAKFNRNVDSSNTGVALVYQTPTINVLGTQRANSMVAANSNQAVQVGGSTSTPIETRMGYNKDLLLRIQNKGGSAQDIGVTINWYEE